MNLDIWAPPLRCLRCTSSMARGSSELTCETCGSIAPWRDSYFDFLESTDDGWLATAETDYVWDYRADPLITGLTEARWRVLASAHAAMVLRWSPAMERMASIGGGGENWSGRKLDDCIGEYVVVDPSIGQLKRQVYPAGAKTVAFRALGEHLPIADGWANVVELAGVLDHAVEPSRVVAEAARIVQPGGIVTVSMMNDGSWYRRGAARARIRVKQDHAHAHHFDVAAARNLIDTAGLEVVESRTLGYMRLPLPVEKLLATRLRGVSPDRLTVLSDSLFRRLLGHNSGGMMVIAAQKGRPLESPSSGR